MKKILNKIISIFTSAVILASVVFGIPLSEFNGLAAGVSAATIDEAYVQKKLAELKAAFSQTGTYKHFTTNGDASSDGKKYGNVYCCAKYCYNCKLQNVVVTNPFAKSSGVEAVIRANGKWDNGRYSCVSFASFAFAYIFGVDPTSGSKQLTKVEYTIKANDESLYSALRPGDYLCYNNHNDSDNHAVIFLGYNSKTKKVSYYESNFDGICAVKYGNARSINYYLTANKPRKYVTVVRYKGYEGAPSLPPSTVSSDTNANAHYIVDKNYSKNDPKNIRASKSSSSALLGTIPKNTVCWVTDISGSGSSRWGKVTYGGVTGYINLYYSVTTSEHQWGGWSTSKAATCTASGTQKRTCGCGKAEEKTIAAKGHSYGSWKTAASATCTAAGTEQRTCSNCGNKETRSTAATGHTYKNETVTPTCTEGGCTKHTCTKCGYSYSNNSTPAAGHKYKDEAIAGGGTKHTCTVCGHSYTDGSAQKPYDVNNDGRITVADAKWVLQGIAGLRKLTPAQLAAADVNGDGRITIADAKWILQVIAGIRKLK